MEKEVAKKSRKGLIFKIVVWTLTILFFGTIIGAIIQLPEEGNCYKILVKMLWFYRLHIIEVLSVYILGSTILATYFFYKQEKTKWKIVVFLGCLFSCIFSMFPVIANSCEYLNFCEYLKKFLAFLYVFGVNRALREDLYVLSVVSGLLLPFILAVKPKKVLWYIFYLLFGLGVAFSFQLVGYLTRVDVAQHTRDYRDDHHCVINTIELKQNDEYYECPKSLDYFNFLIHYQNQDDGNFPCKKVDRYIQRDPTKVYYEG